MLWCESTSLGMKAYPLIIIISISYLETNVYFRRLSASIHDVFTFGHCQTQNDTLAFLKGGRCPRRWCVIEFPPFR